MAGPRDLAEGWDTQTWPVCQEHHRLLVNAAEQAAGTPSGNVPQPPSTDVMVLIVWHLSELMNISQWVLAVPGEGGGLVRLPALQPSPLGASQWPLPFLQTPCSTVAKGGG